MAVHQHQNHESSADAPREGADQPHAGRAPVRILVIEDMAAEAELAIGQIRRQHIACVWHRVDNERALREALREFDPNVILSDFTLPRFDGMSALAVARELAPEVPFIFVSGTIGEERAIQALHCGATDYVFKTNLGRLTPAVTRALDEACARSERRRQEQQIARLTRVLRMLSGINGAVLRIQNRDELFDEACRLAVSVGGYASAQVLLREPGTNTVQAVAGTGVDQQPTQTLRALSLESADSETGMVASVLRTGEIFTSGRNDTPTQANDMPAQADERAIVALPLLIDKTAIGVLMLRAADPALTGEEELQMLREVAANLSFALQYLQKDHAVQFLAYFDPHTGLPKRPLFCERLERLRARDLNPEQRRAVAVVDVEQLSAINDSFGRHTGDILLQHVTDRLRRQFQYTELLARLGGGTFAVAVDTLTGIADPTLALKDKLDAIFGRPFDIDGRQLPVIVKSGLALYPEDGRDAATLLQNAEVALYNARARGQRHLRYSAEQHSEVVARLALEHQLRTAIAQRQFELHYQPKVNIRSGRIDSVEGLIRWRHPEAGLTAPAAFLPLLESTGLIVEVGDWVIGQAVSDCRLWQRLGLPPVRIAVNISPLQLQRADFAQRFLDRTQSLAATRCGLDIEITESAVLDNCTVEVEQLQRLRAAGVGIAIDDFGMGYSSLSRLSDLPIDTLKIDRTFIDRLTKESSGKPIVVTIITLAHAFGMRVIAEGVETAAQLDALFALGCDEVQGYLLSKPLPPDDLVRLLQTGQGHLNMTAGTAH